jgi:hypothetical protein
VRGPEYVGQKIKQRLLFFRGEWWKDTTLGVPWLQQILIHQPSLEVVRSVVRSAILDVPMVTSVPVCTVEFDSANRVAAITFEANTVFGQTVQDTVDLGIS